MPPDPEAGPISGPPLKAFISYSREDADLRTKLSQHLAPLLDEGLIQIWYDNEVTPGTDFNAEIASHLEAADLIILLVSAPFLASDYIKRHELPRALDREEQGKARVIPILLRPVGDWRVLPLFKARQGLPSGNQAVTEFANIDTALARVAEGLRKAAEEWRETRGAVAPGANLMNPIVGAVAQAVRIEFVYASMDAGLFEKIERNPFREVFEPGDGGDATARAFLWMPSREALGGDLLPFTTTAVICDPGRTELDKLAGEMAAGLERARAFYKIPPSGLDPAQRRELAGLAGKVLSNTFIIAAGMPRLLLGTRVDDLELAYQILLNAMVLPLAAGHAALKFRRFELSMSPADEPGAKSRPVEAHAKKLLKAKFPRGGYSVAQPDQADPLYFYLYAARFIQWAAHRHFNEGKSDWLDTLRECFR